MNREGDEPGTPGEGANPFDDNPSFDGGLPSPPPVRVSTPADRRFSLNMLMASAPSVNALLEPQHPALNSARDSTFGEAADLLKPREASPELAGTGGAFRRLDTIRENGLKNSVLIFVFLVIFLINTLINIDHGVIPAATTPIKDQYGIQNSQLGLLGSMVYFGLTLGSFVAPFIIQRVPPKWLILGSLTFELICLVLFTLTSNFVVLMISRGGVGFFQVFMVIYFPVWVDLFAPKKYSTLWMTLLQVAVPMGVTVGYVMTAIISTHTSWKWAFWVQTFIFSICFVLVIFTSSRYLDAQNLSAMMTRRLEGKKTPKRHGRLSRSQTICTENRIGLRRRLYSNDTEDENNIRRRGDSFHDSPQKRENTPSFEGNVTPTYHSPFQDFHRFQTVPELRARPEGGGMVTVPNSQSEDQFARPLQVAGIKDKDSEPTCKEIFMNHTFTFTMLAISCLYFVITGIQFWVTDYMTTVIKLDKKLVFTFFGVVSITSTLCGVVVGGIIIHRFGGYSTPKSFKMCLAMAFAAGVVGAPIPFVTNAALLGIFLSLLLFCGSFIMPSLTGKMISCVPKPHRAYANSMGAIFMNLLGYLPAPFLYGLVDQLDGEKSNAGMILLMCWIFLGAFLLMLAVIASEKIWCFRPPKRRKLMGLGDVPMVVLEAKFPIAESQEESDSPREPLIPDSGSTEQQRVKEALGDEHDYYDEQKMLLQKRHSYTPAPAGDVTPGDHVRSQSLGQAPPSMRDVNKSSSLPDSEEEGGLEASKHLAEILGLNVLNQY